MEGLLQDSPLTLRWLFDRLERIYPAREVATAREGHVVRRRRYCDLAARARRLGAALEKAGVGVGERVATLCFNSDDHLEQMLGIMAAGRVYHALNPRLSNQELEYIIGHAGDAMIFVDEELLPKWSELNFLFPAPQVVVVRPPGSSSGGLETPGHMDYETFLEDAGTHSSWAELDEREAAALCYTSGTTGAPKGVLYSHRGLLLVSFAWLAADAAALSQADTFMPVVPFFHAQAWALPLSALLAGARIALTGADVSPNAISRLAEEERVTLASGVPTIWRDLLSALQSDSFDPQRLESLQRIICGGSAVSETMLEAFDRLDVQLIQVWGMTEMSPLGTVSRVRFEVPEKDALRQRSMQGQISPLVALRIVGEDGTELPWDGETAGEVEVSGPWIADAYYDPASPGNRMDGGAFSTDDAGRRWLRTGDIGTVDPLGQLRLVDRAKDLIKSGGEWISSVELEQIIEAHPGVSACAVIAVHHPRWEERPLAVVETKDGAVSADVLLDRVRSRLASWQVPDGVEFVSELPRNSLGKIDKKVLRERFANAHEEHGNDDESPA